MGVGVREGVGSVVQALRTAMRVRAVHSRQTHSLSTFNRCARLYFFISDTDRYNSVEDLPGFLSSIFIPNLFSKSVHM